MRQAVVLLLLLLTVSVARAEPPLPFQAPAGWKSETAGSGVHMFTPDPPPHEGAAILLFPVMTLPGDPAETFDAILRRAFEGKKVLQQSETSRVTHGDYRDFTRLLVLVDAQGQNSYVVCLLTTREGRGQVAIYAAGSQDAFQRYLPAASAFQQSLNFARLAASPESSPNFSLLGQIANASLKALAWQEQTQYESALEIWREVEKLIASAARFPQAKAGSLEAFWDDQIAAYQRRTDENILNCMLNLGRFEEVAQRANTVIEAARKRADPVTTAAALATLGSARYSLLDYDGARAALLEAHSLIDTRFTATADAVAKILAKPAASVTAEDARFVNHAFTLFSEARTQYSKIFALFLQLGLFEEAIALWESPHFLRLESISEDASFRRVLEVSVSGLGPAPAAEVIKRYDSSLPLSRQERTTSLLTAWRLKAQESGDESDWKRVREYLAQASALAAKYPDAPFQQAAIHGYTGTVAAAMQHWDEAAKEFEKALELSQAIAQPAYRESLRQILLLREAEACAETGRAAEALKALQEVEKTPSHADRNLISIYLFTRGKVMAAAQQPELAFQAYARCLDAIEAERSGVKAPELLKNFNRRRLHMYEDIIYFLMRHKNAAGALEVMEKSRSRTLSDIFKQTLVKKGNTLDFTAQVNAIRERERLREIEQNRNQSLSLEATAQGPSRTPSIHSVDQALAASPELTELTLGFLPPNVRTYRDALDDSTLVLSYYFGERHSAVVATDLKGQAIYPIELTRDSLLQSVQELRGAIESGEGEAWRAPAAHLYQALIAPAEKHLAHHTRLVIVPYAAGNYLPWSVLGPAQGKSLVDDHEIVLLPSLQSLALCRAKTRQQPNGGVAFAIGDVAAGNLPALPGTRDEVKSIAAILPTMQVFINRDFTFANVARQSRKAPVLHFATHGFTDGLNPERSGIVTAEGNLYLPDIVNLDLHAGLVVLSACSTGLGKILGGDEMIGLTRSFMYAGTPSIVATLWMVADQPTPRFMALFYENLKAGRSKSAALREAQLALRKDFPHPLYWAPFTLYGDWQ